MASDAVRTSARFWRQIWVEVVAIIALAALGLAVLLHIVDLARLEQQRTVVASQVDIVRGLAEIELNAVARLALDYGYWDEGYQRLSVTLDRQWAKENLGAYLHSAQGVDIAAVLDGSGRPQLVFLDGEPVVAVGGLDGGAVANMVAAARRAPPTAAGVPRAVVALNNGHYVMAAFPSMPQSVGVADAAQWHREHADASVILFGKRIDSRFTGQLTSIFHLKDVSLSAGACPADVGGCVALGDPQAPVGHVRFDVQGGGDFFSRVWPSLLVVLLAVLSACAIAMVRVVVLARNLIAERQGLQVEASRRTRSEEDLRISEERFMKAFMANPSAMSITRMADGLYHEVNDMFLQTLACTRDEVIGRTSIELGFWDDVAQREVFVGRVKREGSLHDFEAVFVTREGRRRTVIVFAEAIEHAGDQWILSSFYDITERKEMEQALRESEERFSKAFRASPVAMAMSDIDDGRLLDVNDAWLATWGGSREEAIGKTAAELRCWADLDQRALFVERLKREGSVGDFEASFFSADGEAKTAVVGGTIVDLAGQPRLLLSFSDITERKRTERALQTSEQQKRHIIETVPDLVWLKDPDGRYLACNKMFERLYGATEEQIVGRTDYDFVDADLADFFRRHDRAAIEADGCLRNEEWLTFADDGHKALFETSKTPLKDRDGTLLGVLGVARDITERKAMERQLAHAQKMEIVGQLAGGAAHDFNNLLQVVQVNLEMIRLRFAQDEKALEYVASAKSAVRRGSQLSQQLLSFSRRQLLHPEVVDANDLVEGTVELLRRTLGEDVEVETRLMEGSGLITIDPNGLENAILNLALNARAAMPAGGRLIIASDRRRLDEPIATEDVTLPAGDYLEISVADTGCGMSAEVMAHAFEPFFTTKESGRGSGLGLSMVYGFALQSKGHVTLESEVGTGTTARMLFPVAAAEPGARRAAAAEDRSRGRTGGVLVVEDDADVRRSVVMLLETLGWRVREADCGVAALAILGKDRAIDLLFTDVVMPGGMSGLGLAREAVRRYPDLKVLLTSGYPEGELTKAPLEESGFPLLAKPYSNEELSEAVQAALTGDKASEADGRPAASR